MEKKEAAASLSPVELLCLEAYAPPRRAGIGDSGEPDLGRFYRFLRVDVKRKG